MLLRRWFRPAPAPMPVIVGIARSGTTLLRLMLDANPRLAMPPETAFLPVVHGRGQGLGPRELADLIVGFPTWPDFHLAENHLREALHDVHPFTVSAGLRRFYGLYADRFGKRRCGEKTPGYLLHMPAIQELLPEAHFVHLIRDGRDVALSLRPLWFAPAQRMAELAAHWRDGIVRARQDAPALRHYLEVRYEELITAPEPTLRRLCDFLALSFAPEMLDYPRRAAARYGEVGDQRVGERLITREQRLRQHPLLGAAPRQDRIGRWRCEMSSDELNEFVGVAGGLLGELGYAVADEPSLAMVAPEAVLPETPSTEIE